MSGNFVHLHTHTEYSPLDGLSTTKEIVAAVKADGQTAVAFTDHGNCAVHPDAQLACEAEDVKPIFGLEAYFADDRFSREGKITDYQHLILLAMDDEGLKNLWAMSTESYRDGLWGKYPRLDWDTLQRLNKGVICLTACLGGPVLNPFIKGNEELALSNLLRLKEIFGDRLYAEIQTGMQEDQLRGNAWLLEEAWRYGIEPVITCDSHYATPDDKKAHKVWLASAIGRTLDELADSSMFEGDEDYHVMSAFEVRGYLGVNRDYADKHGGRPDYLDEILERAYTNTKVIADRCTAKIQMGSHNPVYSRKTAEHPNPAKHDIERLLTQCMNRWDERTGGKKHGATVYTRRFENEFTLIAKKGFAGYFLMVADIVMAAKDAGVLVGPGRGSGGGSLVAYLLGITEIDPVEHDVLFERFMTKGRTELPDFDIDFPSSKKAWVFSYVANRWGAPNVCTVGTHMRLKSKSVIQSVARALKGTLPEGHWTDIMELSKIIDAAEGDTAGLGLSWDELWDRAGDLMEPYAERYPEVFLYAKKFHGRLKSYGKHPAGVIIDPDHPLTENLPLRMGEDGTMIAQFDLKVLELLGYVKFDLLNIANLDMIQTAMDLIYERTGKRVDPYSWTDEMLNDPLLYDEIGKGHCLGLFQIGSAIGTAMSRRMKPDGLHELADMVTLVRPGPARSGLTDRYLARRKGEEDIYYPDERMREVLGKTWGAMIYQEQLMKLCMVLANYDDVESDKVRKILGKKKVEEAKKQGAVFIERAMANGTDEAVTRELWAQMEEFARYSFGFAHALAYGILAVWTAWFKFHYPLYFLCGALSTVKDENLPAFVEEARRMGYKVLPPDINLSGRGFALGDTGLDIRYGLDSIKGLGAVAVESIIAAQPYTSWDDFIARRGSKVNKGHIATMVKLGVFDSLEPNRRVLEQRLVFDALPAAQQCVHRVSGDQKLVWLPSPKRGVPAEPETVAWTLPCGFDWEHEPDSVSERTGKLERRKAPPKTCSKGCRQWTQGAGPEDVTLAPYTAAEIRAIEQELLGTYLSSTPFDVIPAEDMEQFATADEIETGGPGNYMVAAVVQNVRKIQTKKGDDMAIVAFSTPRGSFTAAAFPSFWEEQGHQFVKGSLAYALVTKGDRGCRLDTFIPIQGVTA
jgi:DNA polymerase III subunit alpha